MRSHVKSIALDVVVVAVVKFLFLDGGTARALRVRKLSSLWLEVAHMEASKRDSRRKAVQEADLLSRLVFWYYERATVNI